MQVTETCSTTVQMLFVGGVVPPADDRIRATTFGGVMSDPMEDDLMATIAGASVLQACGGPKKVASAAGVDESNGRRYARGDKANPVYRTRVMIEAAQDPYSIVAYLIACAIRAELKRTGPMPEWRWRALYVEALEAEQKHDASEDVTSQKMLMGKASLADMIATDTAVVAPVMRRLALSIIGQQRGFSLNGPRGAH